MSNTSDPISAMMNASQTALQNPMAQSVPQSGGVVDPSQHPIVGAIIKALSNAAQSYGWTSMYPQERLERTQMEQQKAETMARLAQTAAYQQGELGYRQQMADTASAREQDYKANIESQAKSRETQNAIKQQALELQKDKNEWMKDMAAGRLEAAKTRISNQASQFEQTFKLRAQQVGIEQAKLELAETGMGIKQGFLDLAQSALSQKGTAEGLNTITKLQSIAYEHPILSQVFGLDDVTKAVQESKGAGIPGVGGPSPTAPAAPTAPIQTPAPNKIAAKRKQKQPSQPSGITHVWTPQGIQPAGQQPE